MVKSMTGFGKGEAECAGEVSFRIEINSVNRKQLEVRCTLPPELSGFETTARRIVSNYISRGSVQLRVIWRNGAGRGAGVPVIDFDMLSSLAAGCLELRRRLGLPETVEVEALAKLPGVCAIAAPDAERPEVAEAFERAVEAACIRHLEMRRVEGAALLEDFKCRLGRLEELFAAIVKASEALPQVARKRLLAKIEAEKLPVAADDPSLLRELLFYADKSDVTEEITRLESHFGQLKKFLAADEPVGRSLDFLAQEFFREITTLGNKAAGPEISPLTVAFKSELEKLREQIQNVE